MSAKHYYNEFNPESAAMIRQMMADNLIPRGDVDTRSITEVSPCELTSYTQCHFFAGIAGWQFALQIAEWPADRPVWTGSAPCQPFSSAGKQKGKADERQLFPVWLDLIRECRPATIFGEQVASAVTHGWLDDVYQGLEEEGYAVGSAILPACSVGAPHRRDRLWFVAHACVDGRGEIGTSIASTGLHGPDGNSPRHGFMADAGGARPHASSLPGIRGEEESTGARHGEPERCGSAMGDAGRPRSEAGLSASTRAGEGFAEESYDGMYRNYGPWNGSDWQPGWDGKARLVEPRISLLADGFQHRRPILHAIGNAIVPQVAAQFIVAAGGPISLAANDNLAACAKAA